MSENAHERRPVRVIPAAIERSVDPRRIRRTSVALFGCGLLYATWFLVEGILRAVLARAILGRPRDAARRTAGAAAGVAALTCVGLLSAFGVVGGWIVG